MRAASRAVPVVLFAVYPVVLLLGDNIGEVAWGDLVLPLVISVGGALLAFAILAAVLRDLDRAAVLTTAGLIAVFSFGYVRDGVQPIGPTAGMVLLAYGLLGALLLVIVVLRRSGWARVRRGLTVVGAILVALALVPIVAATTTADTETVVKPEIGAASKTSNRDIYYIVLDRYPSEHAVRDLYGVDQPALYERLPELGFTVVPDSGTNYPRTILSMASSLNVNYLSDLVVGRQPGQSSQGPYVELLRDPAVGRFLKDQGYTFVQVGSWWDPTAISDIADVNPRFDDTTDFQATLTETTILPEILTRLRRLGLPIPQTNGEAGQRHYQAGVFGLDNLEEVAKVPGPKFVLAHILLPHEPFVFDRDGSYVPLAERRTESRSQGFARQLAYVDQRIGDFLAEITDVPGDQQPIVMLQADEGPFPERWEKHKESFAWLDASDAELDEKFGILNAFFLPGQDAPAPYPGISPVNGFRLVLGSYFGVDLPLLPDRHFLFRDATHQYDLIDDTDRIDRVLAGH